MYILTMQWLAIWTLMSVFISSTCLSHTSIVVSSSKPQQEEASEDPRVPIFPVFINIK